MSSSATIDKPNVSPPDVWPPDDDGGGGGGGGGDGFGEPHESGPPISSSRLATIFILAMVTMFFAAWFSLYEILRSGSSGGWRLPRVADVDLNLWISTGVILISSITGALAVRSAARGMLTPLRFWLFLTLCLGFGFCGTQAVLWRQLVDLGVTMGSDNFDASVYSLTALHVAHVIGGIVYLTLCFVRALTGHRLRGLPESLSNCMLYWHFVGVIWYLIFFWIS